MKTRYVISAYLVCAVYEERLDASEKGRSLKSFQEVFWQNETCVNRALSSSFFKTFSLAFLGTKMQSSAYGASLAGGTFDFLSFLRQPQTILRFLSWVSDYTETLA